MTDDAQENDRQEIERLDKAWGDAASRGDLDGVVGMYAVDGSLVWPDQKAIHGIDGIRKAWKAMLKPPGLWIRFIAERIVVSGDLASDFGVVESRVPPTAKKQVTKYLVVWRREQGAWKVLYDSYNTNKAEAPPTGGGGSVAAKPAAKKKVAAKKVVKKKAAKKKR